MMISSKPLAWVGTSKKDLLCMPIEVVRAIGYSLHLAQSGKRAANTKSLSNFGSAGVLEVIEEFDGNAYRAVYTIKLADSVYVLHCFQKKSNKGIATRKSDMDLVRDRLRQAIIASRSTT